MEVIQQLIPKGHPNRPGIKLEALKAVVVHYTNNANPNMGAKNNIKWLSRACKEIDGKRLEADGKSTFNVASAHIFCDEKEIVLAIPTDEVAWSCGDRNFSGDYQQIAYNVFGKRQNYQIVSVEICNNADWNKAANNAKEWIIDFIKSKGLQLDIIGSLHPQKKSNILGGEILLLRHYDITGKNCPAAFVKDIEAWKAFIQDIADATKVREV
ncbi:MAG: N-acetylmuramoyl-L-alanine amidase [Clostridiales bacterium]|jgi:N-acetylmuramoyl-L-alanine amidase|nr:N-acetylmuramoyl-L-alanine amidase [Clostridiales bacterium]